MNVGSFGRLTSPIGLIEVRGGPRGVQSVRFVSKAVGKKGGDGPVPDPVLVCLRQLDEYFQGVRGTFSVKLDLRGTDFQMKIWRLLLDIPYGRTASYRRIAAAAGNARATRAVGGANHRNPVSIIVPCHRVVGSDGRLTGYGGGLWRKEWLLAHERRNAPRS